MTVLKVLDVEEKIGSGYPAPFDEPCQARSNRSLGDAFGLKDFGVQLTVLHPGSWSSQRHWHTLEDELVYVLEGTPTLITEMGEKLLESGDVVGFPAGSSDGHHFVNNSGEPVSFLVVGTRHPEDDAYYPDIDLQILKRGQGGVFSHKNGEPY